MIRQLILTLIILIGCGTRLRDSGIKILPEDPVNPYKEDNSAAIPIGSSFPSDEKLYEIPIGPNVTELPQSKGYYTVRGVVKYVSYASRYPNDTWCNRIFLSLEDVELIEPSGRRSRPERLGLDAHFPVKLDRSYCSTYPVQGWDKSVEQKGVRVMGVLWTIPYGRGYVQSLKRVE